MTARRQNGLAMSLISALFLIAIAAMVTFIALEILAAWR
jgi:hypothetical protein